MSGIPLLIMSILGLFPCCSLLSPISWFLANNAQKSGNLAPGDVGTTNVAKIIGIIGTVFLILSIIILIKNGGHVNYQVGTPSPTP